MKALRTALARAYRSLSARRRRRRAVDILAKSGLIDVAFYESQVGRTFDGPRDAAEHVLRTPPDGSKDPHPLFSTAFYLSRARDVAAAGTNPLLHFIENGAAELRQPHPLFDLPSYVARHGDQPGVRTDPVRHYLETGWRLGFRAHALFDERWYLDTYPDVAAQDAQPLLHFLTKGRSEKRDPSRHFDTGWYLARYPDADTGEETALQHYLRTGARELRDPSAAFDTAWYRDAYPDVAASGMNPLVHFVEHGLAGGYVATPLVPLDARFGLPASRFHVWRARRAAGWMAARSRAEAGMVPSRVPHAESPAGNARSPAPHAEVAGAAGPRSARDCGASFEADLRSAPQDEEQSGPKEITVLAIPRRDVVDAADRTRMSASEAGAALGLDAVTLDWGAEAFATLGRAAPDGVALVLEAGDLIDATGLAAVAATFEPRVRLAVFDTYHTVGDETFPVLQPGANPGHLRSIDSTFSRFAVRAGVVNEIASRSGSGLTARKTLLAALDLVSPDLASGVLAHCPIPVVETRDLQADIRQMRQEVIRSGRSEAQTAPSPARSISVVICTKDKGHLLGQLLQHLAWDVGSGIAEIIVVSNGTTNPFALRTLATWRSHPLVRIVGYDRPFNFSEQCNVGASESRGELLLFLNDDIVPTRPDWLARLSEPFLDPGVGIVGPLLLYPDETVQHAGMFVGYRGGAGHVLRHARLPDGDYLFLATAIRDVSCVTGAALLIRRSLFSELGGFDVRLPSIYQDVDLCLRARCCGRRILFVPDAVALHMESASLKETLDTPGVAARRDDELSYFAARHREELSRADPFLNPNVSLADEDLRSLRT